ncbi:mucin-6-like [Osmerus mordax]|uniref:mucin-6-like n=1 Tax=Osmerus mordax TaxID=8014 RepID=UPI00350EE0AA
MSLLRRQLVVSLILFSDTCKTFGSGVVRTYNSTLFYVRSTCPFTLTRFTYNRVDFDITVQRDDHGLLTRVEISVNKIRTVLQDGTVFVEQKSVSLPYDHTYQHIFQYGIYTRLKSTVLPVSVTWHSTTGGIDSLWVNLQMELTSEMGGLCGARDVVGEERLIAASVLSGEKCQTKDSLSTPNMVCRDFLSMAMECVRTQMSSKLYLALCDQNIFGFEGNIAVKCSFYNELLQKCERSSIIWFMWRTVTKCNPDVCPGELVYQEEGNAYNPSCSSPSPVTSGQDLISTCVCQDGKVLNDRVGSHSCVMVSDCPCVHAGRTYSPGQTRSTKCQTCLCKNGKWQCSKNICPPRCIIEGRFVTTFDGKHYSVPGMCTYVASQGINWTISIQYSETTSLKNVILQVYKDTYKFSHQSVQFENMDILELHQSGLCGNYNSDTTDDFTASSGIVENSAEPFALSWSVGACSPDIPKVCINADNAQISCENNLKFDYNMQACNHTCLSLSGPDPRCGVEDAPVEGCGCLEGTHLNKGLTCSPKAQCPCSHQDSSIPTGPVVIDGRQW